MSEFLLWPDRRLRETAAPVERVDDEARAIWARMLDAMYAMLGVGLAAPQIGVPLRLAVADCAKSGRAPVRLANPELLEASDEMRDHEEASPNLPGISARVSRSAAVRIGYIAEAGAPAERWFEGLWSTSVQHQIDHLDGLVFVDRLSRMKRRMALDRYAKQRRRG